MVELTATVVKRLFVNQETDYAVLRVVSGGEEFTVRGQLSALGPGAEGRFEGEWEQHNEYGRQLAVSAWELLLPVTEKGITGFLASGILPGIGMEKARKIVRAFGRDTFNIIDNYPGRLAEIQGIAKKNVPKITAAWKKLREERSSMAFFQEIGISRRVGQKLLKELGAGAAQLVKEDPYRLAGDVSGIGFVKADAIAAKLGIVNENPQRVASGIIYSLEQTAARGHSCFPADELCAMAAKLLDVPENTVSGALEALVGNGRIMTCGNMAWHAPLWYAEKNLAADLGKIASAFYDGGKKDRKPSSLNQEQLDAVEKALSCGVSVITGGPGTGKTTVVSEIVRRGEAMGLDIILTAPTGRAAKRLAEATGKTAKTIHRTLGCNPGESGFVHNASNLLEADMVIVDEVSMLDVELAASLVKALRKPAKKKEGVRLVLVGDADQLPSVGPGRVMADIIESGRFPVTRLVQVYRQQSDSGIITNASLVNAGRMPRKAAAKKESLEEFYWIECEDALRAQELVLKLVAERIPERFGFDPVEDIQVLTPMNKGDCGTWELNRLLRDKLNSGSDGAGGTIESSAGKFSTGDKVMQIKNDYDRNVFNGDLGRITCVNAADGTLSVCFDGDRIVEYDTDSAAGLRNAYAATVHKAQGAEFPAVVLVMMPQQFMMLERKMLYTAITRAKKLFILIAPEKTVAMTVRNYRAAIRYSGLGDFLRKG